MQAIDLKKLKFENLHMDVVGQDEHKYQLVAHNDVDVFGFVSYTVFEGDVHIDFIEVDEKVRRRGIGTRLISRLEEENPDSKINWGYTSREGDALKESIERRRNPLKGPGRRRYYRTPDWAEEFVEQGHHIDRDGTIVVYHATTAQKAAQILKDKILKSPLDAPDSYGVYFSTSPDVAENYGDGTLVALRVRVEDLFYDDVFPSGRIDFHAKTFGNRYHPVAVSAVE